MHGLGSWALKLPASLTLLTIAFAAAAVLAARSSRPRLQTMQMLDSAK
jgi:hypothetical protein